MFDGLTSSQFFRNNFSVVGQREFKRYTTFNLFVVWQLPEMVWRLNNQFYSLVKHLEDSIFKLTEIFFKLNSLNTSKSIKNQLLWKFDSVKSILFATSVKASRNHEFLLILKNIYFYSCSKFILYCSKMLEKIFNIETHPASIVVVIARFWK